MGAGTTVSPKAGFHIGKGRLLSLEVGGVEDGIGHFGGFLDYLQTLPLAVGYVKCNIANRIILRAGNIGLCGSG